MNGNYHSLLQCAYGRSSSSVFSVPGFRRFLAHICFGLALYASLALPVIAQSNVVPTQPQLRNMAIGHPEGTQPPPFAGSSDVIFAPTGSPGPGEVASLGFNPSYIWTNADGSTYTRTFGNFGASNVPYSTLYGGFDLNFIVDAGYAAMTPTGCALWTNGTNWQYPGPYVLGVTQVIVKTVDGSALPSPCVVNMSNYYGPVSSFTLTGTNSSCYFGQGYYIRADAPYPQGLVGDSYNLYVTAPGYSTSGTPYNPGAIWPGQTYTVTLSKTGTASAAPVASATPAANDTAAGVAAASGSGSGTSSGSDLTTLNGFVSNFWDTFKKTLTSLFVPSDNTALDALKASASRLSSWGPFGIVPQVAALFGNLSAASSDNTQQKNGTYWHWVFTPPDFGEAFRSQQLSSGFGSPLGYDPSLEPIPPVQPTIYDSIMPQYLDLTPFADVLLFSRRMQLLFGWLFFLSEMVALLIPKPGV